MPPIYLHYNTSPPIDPAVVSAMRPFLSDAFASIDGAPDMLFVGGEIPSSGVAQLVGFGSVK